MAAESFSADAARINAALGQIPKGWESLDIGAKTIANYTGELADAKTILWNGPMGVFELEPFAAGTKAIAVAVAKADAYTVVGAGIPPPLCRRWE